jgi:hypothetical protein
MSIERNRRALCALRLAALGCSSTEDVPIGGIVVGLAWLDG